MKYVTFVPLQSEVKQVHRSMTCYRKTSQSYVKGH